MGLDWLKRLDPSLWPAGALAGALGAGVFGPFRASDPRALLIRPGGMGDLILLQVAVEELGIPTERFCWLIETRSEAWAIRQGLPYLCIDRGVVSQHVSIAGRFREVINTEQRFGLSHATARLARKPGGRLHCFSTNLAASRAKGLGGQAVPYDPDASHESVEFARLVSAALGVENTLVRSKLRKRRQPVSGSALIGVGGLQSESRRLTEDQWAKLLEAWRDTGGKSRALEIASAPVDREFARSLARRLGGIPVFEGDFGALCDRISGAEEVFTIDSGFHHMASYYGVPTTTIFTSGRELKWASLSEGSRIIRRSDLECQPCTLYGQVPACSNQLACKDLDFKRDLRPAPISARSVAAEMKRPSPSGQR